MKTFETNSHWFVHCHKSVKIHVQCLSIHLDIVHLAKTSEYYSLYTIGKIRSKEFSCNAEDTGLIPGWRRSTGKGNINPLQCSCLGNPMDREAWSATLHGVTKSWIGLSNYTTKTMHISLPLESPSHHPPSHLSRSSQTPSWASCATQQLRTSYLFHTWWCIYCHCYTLD